MTNAPGFFYNEREERMAGEALKVSKDSLKVLGSEKR